MSKKILLTALIVVLCHGNAWPQNRIAEITFDEPLPPDWWRSPAAEVSANHRRSGEYSLRFTGHMASLTSCVMKDVARVEYWVSPPKPGDNLIFVLEYSPDGANWIEIERIEQVYNALSASNSRDFQSRLKPINRLGNVFLKWRILEHQAGDISLDDIVVTGMDEGVRKQQEDLRKEQELRVKTEAMIREEASLANWSRASDMFDDASRLYMRHLVVLVNTLDKVRGIKILSEVVAATNTRNKMANPLAYSAFNVMVKDLKTVLPEIKRSRLNDLLSLLPDPAGAAVRFLGRGVLGIFVNSFKDLVMNAYSDENLLSTFPRKDKEPRYKRAMEERIAVYGQFRVFLNALMSEYDAINSINERNAAIVSESSVMSMELMKYLPEYLKLCGCNLEEADLDKLQKRDRTVRDGVQARISEYYRGVLGSEQEYRARGKLSDEQRRVLKDSESNMSAVDGFVSRYKNLTSNLEMFLSQFKDSLTKNPFSEMGDIDRKDSPFHEWEMNKSVAEHFLESARQEIDRLYLKIDLYETW